MKQQIFADKAYSAPGLLSQAIISNGFIFTSGYIHITKDGTLIKGSTKEKFEQIMFNLGEVLNAAGTTFNDVVKVTIYVTDISMVPELNEYYKTYFTETMPAREAICVKALPLGADLEISMVAVQP